VSEGEMSAGACLAILTDRNAWRRPGAPRTCRELHPGAFGGTLWRWALLLLRRGLRLLAGLAVLASAPIQIEGSWSPVPNQVIPNAYRSSRARTPTWRAFAWGVRHRATTHHRAGDDLGPLCAHLTVSPMRKEAYADSCVNEGGSHGLKQSVSLVAVCLRDHRRTRMHSCDRDRQRELRRSLR
jgi:hypothetical protein